MRQEYKIDTRTKLFGLLGSPVVQSHSPRLFNAIFKKFSINAVYLAFEGKDIEALLKGMEALSISGVSVTMPHKRTACKIVGLLG